MNELLQKVEQATLEKAKPQYVNAIKKAVLAGKKVMYSEQTREMFIEQMKQGSDPETIGAGVAKLMGVLMSQAKGTMPAEVLVPAATLLMCEGLQFLEDSGMKIDGQFLAASTKATGSAVLQMLGVTPEKLQSMMAQKQPGIVQGAK